jgi:hypothetical protein
LTLISNLVLKLKIFPFLEKCALLLITFSIPHPIFHKNFYSVKNSDHISEKIKKKRCKKNFLSYSWFFCHVMPRTSSTWQGTINFNQIRNDIFSMYFYKLNFKLKLIVVIWMCSLQWLLLLLCACVVPRYKMKMKIVWAKRMWQCWRVEAVLLHTIMRIAILIHID